MKWENMKTRIKEIKISKNPPQIRTRIITAYSEYFIVLLSNGKSTQIKIQLDDDVAKFSLALEKMAKEIRRLGSDTIDGD